MSASHRERVLRSAPRYVVIVEGRADAVVYVAPEIWLRTKDEAEKRANMIARLHRSKGKKVEVQFIEPLAR